MLARRETELSIASRGALVGIVHDHMLRLEDDSSNAAAALSLLSNEVETATKFPKAIYTLSMNAVQLCIGLYLLAAKLGWICLLPVAMAFGETFPPQMLIHDF